MSKADHLVLGDHNAVCFECGRKFKASMLRRHWQGYYVCPAHWESRQTQDFVRAVPDDMNVPWSQPIPADVFSQVCMPNDQTPIPRRAIPSCVRPGDPSPFYLPTAPLLD